MIALNFGTVAGLTGPEQKALDELVRVYSLHQAGNAEKEKYYEEVVFSDQAPDIQQYKTYYESIDPENAEVLYKQVVEQITYDSQVEDYAKTYSKAFESDYSPWKSNYEEMAKKTVIKQALKYAPIKTEFQRALSTDETIKSRLSSDMATEVENEMVYENSEMELNK